MNGLLCVVPFFKSHPINVIVVVCYITMLLYFSIKYFKEAIKIDKFNSESYYNYISAKKILENDEIFIKLQNLVEEEKLPEVQNFKMYYSLSKSYFDIDNKDLAFKYLELASNFKLKEISLSPLSYV